jgi:pimeloyl-ACP methyl ester carboxylesterase
VIRAVVNGEETVDVVGFSQGATTAYLLASRFPSLVHRVVAIAGALGTYGRPAAVLEQQTPLTPDAIQKEAPDLVARRKRLMSDPDLWEEMIRRTESMYSKAVFVRQDAVRAIQAPTLLIVGDQDRNNPVEHISAVYRLLARAELAVVSPDADMLFSHAIPHLPLNLSKRSSNNFRQRAGSDAALQKC